MKREPLPAPFLFKTPDILNIRLTLATFIRVNFAVNFPESRYL
jgi:hypothetical protein